MVHGAAGSTQIGLAKNLWSPAAVGRSFDLTPSSLTPLEPFRDYLTIVSNTDVQGRRGVRAEGDRRRSLPLERRVPDAGAPEADRRAPTCTSARRWTSSTRSGSGRTRRSRRCSCASRTSIRPAAAPTATPASTPTRSAGPAPTEPLPMVRDPRAAFDQLFGVGATPAAARREPPHRPQHPRLGHRRGGAHRARSSARRTGAASISTSTDIREIERRIQRVEAHNASGEPRELPGAPAGVPDSFERARQADVRPAGARVRRRHHARVLVQARTRRLGARLSGERRDAAVPPGVAPRRERGRASQQFAQINKYHVGLVPYFLEKLKSIQEGDANLLDKTLVIYGSPMGNSNIAQPQALPAVPRRPRQRHAQGRPAPQGAPTARRWPTRCSRCCTASASTT